MRILHIVTFVAVANLIFASTWASDHRTRPNKLDSAVSVSGVVIVDQYDRAVLGVAGTGAEGAESCTIQAFVYDAIGNVTGPIDVDAPKGFGFVTTDVSSGPGERNFAINLSCSEPIARSFNLRILIVDSNGQAKVHYPSSYNNVIGVAASDVDGE